MFKISEVDAEDLSFDDEDFLNFDKPFSVNLSSEFNTNVPSNDDAAQSEPVTNTTVKPSVKKFSFKSKLNCPPPSNEKPTTKFLNRFLTPTNSLTSSIATKPLMTGVKDGTLPSQKTVLRGRTNNQEKESAKESSNVGMLVSPEVASIVSPSQQTPKSQRFSWNKSSDLQELNNANCSRDGEQNPTCQRSALQVLQKNMISGNRQYRTTSPSQSTNTLANSVNQPKHNTTQLRNIANRKMNNNYEKSGNNTNLHQNPQNVIRHTTDNTAKFSFGETKTNKNFDNGGNIKTYPTTSSQRLSDNSFKTASSTTPEARLQLNSLHHTVNTGHSNKFMASSSRPHFKPQSSLSNPRFETPTTSNKHRSPRIFGAGSNRLRDCVTKTPEPVFSAAQTPRLTPRVAEMCRTPTATKSVEKSRLRKFPGPAGILPKLPENFENQFNVFPDTEEKEEEILDTPSSHTSVVVDDFSSQSWKTMLQVLDIDKNDPQSILGRNNIALVLRKASLKQLQQNKVAQLCVLLKTIQYNGSDASSLLKDPTGEIQGTIHRKLIEDHKEELKPGCVLILRQVGVLSPSLRNHYLNITPSNLVHIFPSEVKGQKEDKHKQLSENQTELSSSSPRLREFISEFRCERSTLVEQNSKIATGDRYANEHLNKQKHTPDSSVIHNSLNSAKHAPKPSLLTGISDDNIAKRSNVGVDDKLPKRVCLGSLPSVGNTEQERNFTKNNNLDIDIDELLQGIDEDELFEDF